MSRWDPERWELTEDGYVRRTTLPEKADFSSMTKPELIAAAEAAGLDSSGNKPDIIARLEAEAE